MKAYLKINPEEKGDIVKVYTTDEGAKRLVVHFCNSIVDAKVEEFEVLAVTREEVV